MLYRRALVADRVRAYVELQRERSDSRHWMNVRCALSHFVVLVREFTWPELHQAAHRFAANQHHSPGYRRQVIAIWRQFLWHEAEAEACPQSLPEKLMLIRLRFPLNRSNGIDAVQMRPPTRNPTSTLPPVLPMLVRTLPLLPSASRPGVELLALTGARPSELFALRTCDIDTSSYPWTATLLRHKTRHRTRSPRYLILARRAIEIIEPRLTPFCPADWIFPAPRDRSRPISTNTVAQTLRRTLERNHLPYWTLYDLRRAAGAIARDIGGLDHAQALLGHADARTTERHYAPVDHTKAALAAIEIDDLLRKEARR